MSDPRLSRLPRIGTLTDRRPPQMLRPGRDPQRPYVDTHASLASLAKHIRIGIDRSKPTTIIATHTLELLLDHIIAVGFGAVAVEKYQQGQEWAAELVVAQQAAAQAQAEEATREDADA